MEVKQIWGILIAARNERCFYKLKPKVLGMFGADIVIKDNAKLNHFAFFKHACEMKPLDWFAQIRIFFRKNASLMDDASIADVNYYDEPDEIIKAGDFRGVLMNPKK